MMRAVGGLQTRPWVGQTSKKQEVRPRGRETRERKRRFVEPVVPMYMCLRACVPVCACVCACVYVCRYVLSSCPQSHSEARISLKGYKGKAPPRPPTTTTPPRLLSSAATAPCALMRSIVNSENIPGSWERCGRCQRKASIRLPLPSCVSGTHSALSTVGLRDQ